MGLSSEIQRTDDAQQYDSGQVERIRRGDRVAFKDFFDAHYEALCRCALFYVHSPEVAEDLVQEVFLDLWNRRRTWHPEHSPKAFLYGAVRHQTLNHRRRLRTQNHVDEHSVLEGLASEANPEHTLLGDDLQNVAERVIDELPERRRQIFLLSRENHLTYAEIATTLDISIKTVETQIGRALRHLRGRLSSLGVFSSKVAS